MDPKRTTAKKEPRFKRTIAKELFEKWRDLVRKGDPETLAKLLNVSKPTIDKALIYGCVHQQALIDGITQYFADRIMAERNIATDLSDLQTNGKKIKPLALVQRAGT